MQIEVQYFAVLADRIGITADTLELSGDATVAAALDALAERHEIIQVMRPSLAAAVDNTYVPPQHRLTDGDILAIIPPVSGG
ncbi:MAG: MoaD/ThiS family protein [Phycisphaerales bacterium]|jgi:molybdopterin converting factor subunit 1|nr:MoaD/ThiS family protein [Phycisphaerales bacterium]MDP6311422.1 MoaD/ThiS family protein [Phycisphaerales bacterium]MDP7087140.1 MoaD/ThiS family protein [Phycisphaerales bacterium]MDP7188375.1 MoaD/ThiS family protein [Phycisphaerales bacterium]MDP7518612.1 MoaD/ThiS family protein [Phycisphaerales bacterium]|tara:strand:+ start:1213 stop:1458 length:246 start_codon:yes stop_codon:yes gene_type:complete